MLNVTKDNFETEVLKSSQTVIVDFNADWCGPCQMMKPIIDEFAAENQDVKIVSVNIDDEDLLAEKYEVSSIPCLVVFKAGEEINRAIGIQSKKKLAKLAGV